LPATGGGETRTKRGAYSTSQERHATSIHDVTKSWCWDGRSSRSAIGAASIGPGWPGRRRGTGTSSGQLLAATYWRSTLADLDIIESTAAGKARFAGSSGDSRPAEFLTLRAALPSMCVRHRVKRFNAPRVPDGARPWPRRSWREVAYAGVRQNIDTHLPTHHTPGSFGTIGTKWHICDCAPNDVAVDARA
jgi:hypothetical protein